MTSMLYEIISRVMTVSISEIDDESGPENIESWDSFNVYVLLDEIEASFGVKFTLDETLGISKVSDLTKLLHKYGKI